MKTNKTEWCITWLWVSELNYLSSHLFNQFLSKGIWSFTISISLKGAIPLSFDFFCFPSIKEKALFLSNFSTYSTLLNWGGRCSIALASFRLFLNFSLFLAPLLFPHFGEVVVAVSINQTERSVQFE